MNCAQKEIPGSTLEVANPPMIFQHSMAEYQNQSKRKGDQAPQTAKD